MSRQVKCRWCEKKEAFNEETMTFIVHETSGGNKSRRYFHHECLNKYKDHQEFVEKEQKELDKLVKIAGEIHDAPKPEHLSYQFPRIWYQAIQDFRNGTQRYTRKMKKRYKKGVKYQVLAEAYKLASDNIKWAKMDKQFNTMEQEVRYCLVIVNSKIPDALRKIERDKQMEKINKARDEYNKENYEPIEVIYKKERSSNDISDFLDD